MPDDRCLKMRCCVVCKAPARSNNFGVLSCDPCKSFFRRASRGDTHKTYRCISGYDCIIDVDGRKSCSYCRYQSCLKAGMDINKVRNDQDRSVQLLKSRASAVTNPQGDHLEQAAKELFQELLVLTGCHVSQLDDKGRFFTVLEIHDLDSLSAKFSQSFYTIYIKEEFVNAPVKSTEAWLQEVIGVLDQHLLSFANSIPQFTKLSLHDRTKLFKGACAELCLINASLTYDVQGGTWLDSPNPTSRFYKNIPALSGDVVVKLFGSAHLHQEVARLSEGVQKFHPDEIVIMLMFAILLFTPTRAGISNEPAIRQAQMYYGMLLKRYLLWRFGEMSGKKTFVELAAILKQFRSIGPSIFAQTHGKVVDNAL